MTENNEPDIFSKDHVPDPVAVRAREFAVKVTDPKPKNSWWSRLLVILAIILILAGTTGAVLGGINTAQNSTQTQTLQQQQACIKDLLRVITQEQQARAQIAADDRNTIRNLVFEVSKAKNQHQVDKAFAEFRHQSHLNDLARERHPLPVVNKNVCDVQGFVGNTSSISPQQPQPTSSHSPSPKKSSSSPQAGSQPFPTPGPTTTQGSAPRPGTTTIVIRSTAPNGQPTVVKTTTTTTRPIVQPVPVPILTPICSPLDVPLIC